MTFMKTRRWHSGLLQQLNCYPQVYERELGLDIPAEEVEPSETKPLEADGMLWLTWLAFNQLRRPTRCSTDHHKQRCTSPSQPPTETKRQVQVTLWFPFTLHFTALTAGCFID